MKLKITFTILGSLILLFITYPLINMFMALTPSIFIDTLKDKEVASAIFLTMRASLWSTIAALVSGVPLAYVLVRFHFPRKKFIEGIVDLPVIIPHSAAGIALLSVWGRKSLFGKITGVSLMGTEAAISIAMFFVAVPFLVNSVKSGLKLIDERYEKVPKTLGASPMQAFFTVTLPMIKKPIFSGAIMMWGRGLSEFGAVMILAYHPMIAPVLIYDRFESFGLKYARPVAVVMILLCLIVFVSLRIIEARDDKS